MDLAAVIYAMMVAISEVGGRDKISNQVRPVVAEELRPVVAEELRPVVAEELREELRQWIRRGGSVEDWLNGHGESNGSRPPTP